MKGKRSKNMVAVSITLPVGLLEQINSKLSRNDQTRSQYFRKLAKDNLESAGAEPESKAA